MPGQVFYTDILYWRWAGELPFAEVLKVKFIGIITRFDHGSKNKADGSPNEKAYD